MPDLIKGGTTNGGVFGPSDLRIPSANFGQIEAMLDHNLNVLVVCGASGTGKTVTVMEIGHNLQRRSVPHALIDTDELDRVWPRPEPVEVLISVSRRNLRALWSTFSDLGVRHLVLSGVMASIPQSEPWIRDSIEGATIVFVRLTAARATREQRLRGREPRSGFEQEMRASDEAAEFIHDHEQPGMRLVTTDDKDVAAVAAEVLRIAGWFPR